MVNDNYIMTTETMKYRHRNCLILLAGLCLSTILGCTSTTSSVETPGSRPDLSGIWQTIGSAHWNLESHAASKGLVTETVGAFGGIPAGMSVVDGGTIPYREEALKQRSANKKNWASLDPAVTCYIPGIPRLTYMPFPFQIFQTDTDIFIAYEFGSNSRLIHMDRPGTEAELPSWMGYSLGRWEGSTLVVDVTDQMPDTWFDSAGNYHTEALKVEERYTLTGPNHIQYVATIDDPQIFTRPWKITIPLYRRMDPSARILEFKCVEFAEDMMYKHLRKGAKSTD